MAASSELGDNDLYVRESFSTLILITTAVERTASGRKHRRWAFVAAGYLEPGQADTVWAHDAERGSDDHDE